MSRLNMKERMKQEQQKTTHKQINEYAK